MLRTPSMRGLAARYGVQAAPASAVGSFTVSLGYRESTHARSRLQRWLGKDPPISALSRTLDRQSSLTTPCRGLAASVSHCECSLCPILPSFLFPKKHLTPGPPFQCLVPKNQTMTISFCPFSRYNTL